MTGRARVNREAMDRLLSQEWLSEGIWCIFCGADRAENRVGSTMPQEPHKPDCIWAILKDRGGAGIAEGGVSTGELPPPEPRCAGIDTGCTGDPYCPIHGRPRDD